MRRVLTEERGQATVEAALLLPAMMLCLTLLVQPACLLYTRAVMQVAAAQTCRALATDPVLAGTAEESYRAYALRRLAAVPNVPIFHKGGEQGWRIELGGLEAGGRSVRVAIATAVQPLPFLGVAVPLLGHGDGDGGVLVEVEVATAVRPEWLEGSYAEWSFIWP